MNGGGNTMSQTAVTCIKCSENNNTQPCCDINKCKKYDSNNSDCLNCNNACYKVKRSTTKQSS